MRTSFSYDFSYSKPEVIRVTANSMVRNLDGSNFKASGVSKIDGDVSRIYVNGKDAFNENMKVIIDGKESSREDLKILKPSQIESVNVKKNMENGKMTGEISINTKKKEVL